MAPRSKKKEKNAKTKRSARGAEEEGSPSPVENSSADESASATAIPANESEPAAASPDDMQADADDQNGTPDANGDNDARSVDDSVSFVEEGREAVVEPFLFLLYTASTSMYTPYDKKTWSPLSLYRTPQHMIMSAIRQSGSEGLSRVELGRVIGLNAGMKSGGRRVSNFIVAAQKAYPQLIDHYQQMDGRQRMFKSVSASIVFFIDSL